MKRRDLVLSISAAVGALLGGWALFGRSRESWAEGATATADPSIPRLQLPAAKWKELLDSNQYAVMFDEQTERPFTSPLNDEHRTGTFVCAACYFPLFTADKKFDSGTGWPSFFDPMPGHVGTKSDYKILIPRTEYHCARCESHQGHVFNDGPQPTGKRYCNNGIALRFVPEGEELPELRQA